jgi:hypothetical protein
MLNKFVYLQNFIITIFKFILFIKILLSDKNFNLNFKFMNFFFIINIKNFLKIELYYEKFQFYS